MAKPDFMRSRDKPDHLTISSVDDSWIALEPGRYEYQRVLTLSDKSKRLFTRECNNPAHARLKLDCQGRVFGREVKRD